MECAPMFDLQRSAHVHIVVDPKLALLVLDKYRKANGSNPTQVILYFFKPESSNKVFLIQMSPRRGGYNNHRSYPERGRGCTPFRRTVSAHRKRSRNTSASYNTAQFRALPFTGDCFSH